MDRKLQTALLAGLLASATMLGSACSRTDPCATAPAPTKEDLALSNAGREVEIEVPTTDAFGGATTVDCELVNGRWTLEQEDV